MLTELKYLTSIPKEWHDKMSCSQLSQHEATFSLQQVIFRKLNYPLLATTFIPDQAKTIMAPILKQGLPSAEIVQTYPWSLVHGPSQYTGLDIPNLYTEQTILHILQVLGLSDMEDVTAFLLRTCSESMRLELGWAGELFDVPTSLQHAVTTSWLKHVWLTSQSLDIRIQTSLVCPPPRQGDIELMWLFLQQGFRNTDQILTLNQCRMHLHTFWLSDLCTGMRNMLVPRCDEERYKCQSSWLWPKTATPLATDWHTWQLALATSLHLSWDKHLVSPLGPWLYAPTQPGWYYEPNTDWLWLVADTQWTFFISVLQRT